jgi:hypothetical protein
MIRKDISSLEIIQNNALTFEAALGPEMAFLQDKTVAGDVKK